MSNDVRLSVQLYSLRHLPRLEDQLRLVHEAGLSLVEATSSNYREADEMRRLFDDLGLAAPSGHVGLDRLRDDFEVTVAVARLLGIETLILWGLPEAEQPKTAAQWRAAGAELGALADRFGRAGLSFAFHNHDWELERFADGGSGLDHLFDGAGGSPLRWQADLAWLARGGADVGAILNTHAARLVSVHVKDLAPPGLSADEEGWADLGHGTLPWIAWTETLRRLGIRLMVLEHDAPNDPKRFLTRSAASARALFGQS